MKTVIGLVLIVGGIALGVWLGLYVMLYGGIMAAINNWGVDNSAVVWGVIRAWFSGLGAIPAYFGVLMGGLMLSSD